MADMGCYQCTDRKPHCHSTCQKHIERTAKHQAQQAEIRAKRDLEKKIDTVCYAGAIKALKRRDHWKEKER